MRPEEALGPIARADQLAIVGDPMQLPPTSFFDVADQVVDPDEAEEMVDSELILLTCHFQHTHRPAHCGGTTDLGMKA